MPSKYMTILGAEDEKDDEDVERQTMRKSRQADWADSKSEGEESDIDNPFFCDEGSDQEVLENDGKEEPL